jgi:8-oxo-dGTP diphosphatase
MEEQMSELMPEPTVAMAIVTSERGVLLARRHDGKPLWTFIGGGTEEGESPSDAAVREVKEEAGLGVRAHSLLGQRVHPKTGVAMAYVACTPANGLEVHVGDPDDHAEVRWVPWSEAEGMLPHLFEPVAEHLRSILT